MLAGQQGAAHALALQAQHDDHVHVADAFVQVVEDRARPGPLGMGRDQGAWGDDADLAGAQGVEGVDLGARHARVQDVADDGHPQVAEIPLVAADGEHVQHALRGVRMAAVAGVDDADVRGGVLRR